MSDDPERDRDIPVLVAELHRLQAARDRIAGLEERMR